MRQRSKPQFWAAQSNNAGYVLLLAGFRRSTSKVIQRGRRYGFVVDVYPREAAAHQRDFAKQGAEVLGRFDTVEAAYACLEQWANR